MNAALSVEHLSLSMGTLEDRAAVPASHVRHREDTRAFVLAEAEPWHREHLALLYDRWGAWNAAHFDGRMVPPYLMLLEPKSARAGGDTSPVSGFGGRSQIRLRPAILTGAAKYMRAGDAYAEGRFRYVADVLLHEMIHQWQQEVTGATEDGYHGHGPAFRDKANEIGRTLGLPPVRTGKARGPDKDLPSCAQWPQCVRPDDYYLGAYIRGVPIDGDAGAEEEAPRPPAPDAIVETLAAMDNPQLARVLVDVLNRRPLTRPDDPNGLDALLGDLLFGLDDNHQCVMYDVVTELLAPDEEDSE